MGQAGVVGKMLLKPFRTLCLIVRGLLAENFALKEACGCEGDRSIFILPERANRLIIEIWLLVQGTKQILAVSDDNENTSITR